MLSRSVNVTLRDVLIALLGAYVAHPGANQKVYDLLAAVLGI